MLEELGNLGDFIGGVAVLVTLIYLSIQIRQNTAQVKIGSEIARADTYASAGCWDASPPVLLALGAR